MKKVTRPTIRTPNEDADPMGLLPALYAKLAETYYAQLSVFLRKFLLVRFEPAVRRSIVDAGTNHGGPISFPATITVYPCDAAGFALVVGRLETPFPEPSDELSPDWQPDHPGDGPYVYSLFTGEPVRVGRPKRGRRRGGRRR
jgi:hypothetical protein